ncbi:MAG TPA: type II toxin-antitoxin system VapC family toxin [Nitrospiraceae bacterium]|nr:type II toxin-antitoxin system VapC family toxin [Nitrospiraceae bacterium]
MNLLLDTCTFLWLITGDSALSAVAREAIQHPAHVVYVSAASLWEVLIKHRLGRLELHVAVSLEQHTWWCSVSVMGSIRCRSPRRQ